MRIFVGWDSRFPEPARVLAYSLRKHSRYPLQITYLHKDYLKDCYGFERKVADPLATTEFTYSRFLVPYLCDYKGKALFLDNDMACFADIVHLFIWGRPNGTSLSVVKHDYNPTQTTKMYGCPQTTYPRKNWSSCMYMNCAALTCWTPELVATASGARLHRFEDLQDNQISSLDPSWNRLDKVEGKLGVDTKILHWTSGGPWNDATKVWPHQDLWYQLREEWIAAGRP